MNVTFETVICAWDEKIPALLIRLVNFGKRPNWTNFSPTAMAHTISGATSAFPKEACSSSKAGYSLRHFNPLIHK